MSAVRAPPRTAMSGVDLATLTALGTWALVVGTLVILWWQTWQTRVLNSANAVMALRERFDGAHLRNARRQLAHRLLENQHDDITNLEIGAFFELIGTLTRRKVLDEDLVWEAFGTWVSGYYSALREPVDMIGRARKSLNDPLVFHEFEWLRNRVLQIDRAMLGTEHSAVVERVDEVRILLQREATLDTL
ncbi:MAG: DUF4760 domain-containing protein [Thermoplasmata archaeon]|nr:DUF4760 domain-containing protein [Thermoplasmata archaeon]